MVTDAVGQLTDGKDSPMPHEHTIICRQLFAGHVVGSRPMKRKKQLLRMIIIVIKRTFTQGKRNFISTKECCFR